MCNVGASLDLYSGTLINMSSIAIKGAGGGGQKTGKGRNRVIYCFQQRGVSGTRCFFTGSKNIAPSRSYKMLKPGKYG